MPVNQSVKETLKNPIHNSYDPFKISNDTFSHIDLGYCHNDDNVVMNKYINRTGVSSPSKTPHNQYNKHIYLQIENNSAPQIGRLTIPTSHNYLES